MLAGRSDQRLGNPNLDAVQCHSQVEDPSHSGAMLVWLSSGGAAAMGIASRLSTMDRDVERRKWGQTIRRLLGASLLVVSIACTDAEPVQEGTGFRRMDFASVFDLLAGRDTVALLLYDPSDCFSCGSPLGQWLAWGAKPNHQVRAFLSRIPKRSELSQILALRVKFKGVISGGVGPLSTPRVYLATNGLVVDSAIGYPAQHRLLSKYRIGTSRSP